MNAFRPADRPERPPPLAECAERHARERPADIAFRFVGRRAAETRELSWATLDARARRVAAGLAERGLAGKPVALICPDAQDFVTALCGCLYAAVLVVPVPAVATRRAAERIRSILDAAKPKAVIAPKSVLVQPWIAGALEPRDIPGIDLDAMPDSADTSIVLPAEGDAAAIIQFTSGSTGAPRGVVLSYANLAANCAAIVETYGLGPESRGVSWLPLHHDMGLVGHVLTTLWVGGRSTIMDPLLFLQSPLRWLRWVGEEAATITSAPNFAYELCVKEAERQGVEGIDLSSLTTAVCGGETVWPETMDRFCRVFSPAGFRRSAFAPSYGLAEATLLVSSGKRPDGPRVFAGAVRDSDAIGGDGSEVEISAIGLGKPGSGVQVRVADSSGSICPDGVVGEIAISGASVGRPLAAGAGGERLQPILTGDLGFVREGELYVVGRRKELIIVRGQNVYPADIENAAVRADPAIRAGAVAAVAVRDNGTEAMLLVFEAERTLAAGEQFREICRRLNETIARATGHMPAQTVAVPWGSLPRTTSGKIRRSEVGALLASGTLPVLAASGGARANLEGATP